MRTRLLLLSALTAVAALAAAGAATAAPKHADVTYSFLGSLSATPANGAVALTVEGGNRRALRAMLGQPVTQTFAFGDSTEFLVWSKGIPTVVGAAGLSAGDVVWLHVRAPRGASLSQLEQAQAGLVGDHGANSSRPDRPLYLFRGRIASVGSSGVTVHVTGGDRRALRLLVGNRSEQTFAVGDETIFLLWQGKVPTVIDASKLVVGDRVTIRVRAPRGSTLARVESTAAVHVGDREPAA